MALAAQTAAAAPKTIFHPPASPFAELLRRSKFASYDPAIRQTYRAPPANAHRGDWGLKRPISLRRKNAFISLTSFEHHAHFTEWNHAENQVRFIRRIEELGGRVQMDRTTAWYKSLGMARTDSEPPFDSDFCPGESAEVVLRPKEQPDAVDLNSLGKSGPGAYGTQRKDPPRAVPQTEVFVTHNINAMSTREFKRYLRSLRAQRPEFQKFVNTEKTIEEKDLYALAAQEDNIYYRRFLQLQMQKEYEDYDGQRIQPQPHPNGALMYARPTTLESLLWTQGKPGFYLNDLPDTRNPYLLNKQGGTHIVSFAGITARVDDAAVVGKKMLFDKTTEEGVKHEDIEESVLQLRLNPLKAITIKRLPHTVGNRPEGLKGVKIEAAVVKDTSEQMGWSNPHPLGSPQYIAMVTDVKKSTLANFNRQPDVQLEGWDGHQSTNVLLNSLSFVIKKNPVKDDHREL